VQARMQQSCECPLGECASTNVAELRMPVGRICKHECSRATNVPRTNVLKDECGGATITRAGV
jgi:hypothetical protein